MKKLALILTLLASCSAFAQGDIEAGKAKSAMCGACHGADGNSLIVQNPKLAGQHATYLEKQIKEFKLGATSGGKQGRVDAVMGGMVMALTEQDIVDIAAYFASNTISDNSSTEESMKLGEKLYRAGDIKRGLPACSACHGVRGNGTEWSGFPKISGQHADYVKVQLEKFRNGTRTNDMNMMMQDVAAKLTDSEISALSHYVGGLH